jgi:hypothetical protein
MVRNPTEDFESSRNPAAKQFKLSREMDAATTTWLLFIREAP